MTLDQDADPCGNPFVKLLQKACPHNCLGSQWEDKNLPHRAQTESGQAHRICRSMSVLKADSIGDGHSTVTEGQQQLIVRDYGHNSVDKYTLTSGNYGTNPEYSLPSPSQVRE